MRNESDEKQKNMEEEESKLTDTEEGNDALSIEHVDEYKGPIIRSRTKKIGKCFATQSQHFNVQSF